jgi:hypothetical protein
MIRKQYWEVNFLFVIYDVDDFHLTPPVSWQFPSLQSSRHPEAIRGPLSLDVVFDLHRS